VPVIEKTITTTLVIPGEHIVCSLDFRKGKDFNNSIDEEATSNLVSPNCKKGQAGANVKQGIAQGKRRTVTWDLRRNKRTS
jgi:hypothetical protein